MGCLACPQHSFSTCGGLLLLYISCPRTIPLCRYGGTPIEILFPEGRYIVVLYSLGSLGDTDPLSIEAVGYL